MLHYPGRGASALCLIIFLSFVFSLTSCVAPKNYVYFNDLKKHPDYPGKIVLDSLIPYSDPKIEANDILSVTIEVYNPLSERGSSVDVSGSAGSSGVQDAEYAANSYQVDKDGYIELGQVGFVKLLGLTTTEARELIKQKAKSFYKDPIVNVHIVNFEVTVLGEVGKVGAIKIKGEKASILDVLALAGDLRPTAKRKEILIARTENNTVTFARIDITTADIYKSPYFYVKQRDLIYIEPTTYARQNTDNSILRAVSYFTAATSIVSFLLFSRIIK